ncbi:MAG: AAA family ATPase [Pseudomonadota bacterium]
MSTSRGITLGKFLPLHKGHELLLRAAAMHCDELTILVGTTPDDAFSFERRAKWIRSLLARSPTTVRASIDVVADPDPNPQVEKDAAGTVVDESYWSQWLQQNRMALANVDTVFTSDRYGAEVAKRIGARWFPVDPDREAVPIAASQIRADTRSHFSAISDVAKPDVATTVAVVGAESTGKSTLVKALAKHYGTSYAPEWGRIVSEAHAELTKRDFDHIISMQTELIRTAQRTSNGLCFADTEAITTALFAPIYLHDEHAASWRCAKAQSFALYLVLDPAVPWIDDGTRVLDTAQRDAFHQALVGALERLNKPYRLVGGDSYSSREEAARSAVDNLTSRFGPV